MVRLKRYIACLLLVKGKNFNPTMVRLKPALTRDQEPYAYKFQSHNGSIKTGILECKTTSIN